MTRAEIYQQICDKRSFLCIGLDTDIKKIPPHLHTAPDPVFEFNRQIIDATQDLCVAYKINTAFYEANGVAGWQSMKRTFDYIPKNIFTIADAKRGDIGNTSAQYAHAFFSPAQSGFDFDALTVAPYMGEDSVTPFLHFKNKWVILLVLTSNKGSADFQNHVLASANNNRLYEQVIRQAQQWGTADQLMFVAGATHPNQIAEMRALAPDHFFLVPGVGTQGGDLRAVAENGMNVQCGLLVNVSRQVIFAGQGLDFAQAARIAAEMLQQQMHELLPR